MTLVRGFDINKDLLFNLLAIKVIDLTVHVHVVITSNVLNLNEVLLFLGSLVVKLLRMDHVFLLQLHHKFLVSFLRPHSLFGFFLLSKSALGFNSRCQTFLHS